MSYQFVLPCFMAMTVTASALAGELSPPTGPVTETGRFGPRVEINSVNTPGSVTSKFIISQPGSYYLGGNISGSNAKHGIEITASGVTIDLMGFDLKGLTPPPGLAGESLDGITGAIGIVNIHIHNARIGTRSLGYRNGRQRKLNIISCKTVSYAHPALSKPFPSIRSLAAYAAQETR